MSGFSRYLLILLPVIALAFVLREVINFLDLNPFTAAKTTHVELVSAQSKLLIDPKPKATSLPASNTYKHLTTLEQTIKSTLAGEAGDYAVVVQDLSSQTPQGVRINDQAVYPSASLYKLFVVAAALQAEELGQLSDDDTLTSTFGKLEESLGGADFGYEDFAPDDQISYKVSEALDRICRLSDNYASIMLADKIGWNNVQYFADQIGAAHTTIKAPISTSAADIALYFQKLYNGEIVSPAASSRIVDLLAKDQINNRIPAGLPRGLKIAHKTGELSNVRHDAGIVYLEGHPYLIVLMSNNVPYEDDAIDVEAKLSKQIYDYFSSQ